MESSDFTPIADEMHHFYDDLRNCIKETFNDLLEKLLSVAAEKVKNDENSDKVDCRKVSNEKVNSSSRIASLGLQPKLHRSIVNAGTRTKTKMNPALSYHTMRSSDIKGTMNSILLPNFTHQSCSSSSLPSTDPLKAHQKRPNGNVFQNAKPPDIPSF